MFEQFKTLLIDEFQVDESKITLDAELSGDLAINSIELAELILRCEEEFGIDIQEEEREEVGSPGNTPITSGTFLLKSPYILIKSTFFLLFHSYFLIIPR